MVKRVSPSTELAIDIGLATDTGRRRSHNEDAAEYFEPDEPELLASRGRLYIVADGMGGGAAGEVASRYAASKILHSYYSPSSEGGPEDRLEAAIQQANADIYEHTLSTPTRRTMGTTVVAALVQGERLLVANVGDSRAYLVRGSTITQLTRDHSLVAALVENGAISPEEGKTHPQRNVILRSVGADQTVHVDISSHALAPGDSIVLCTDGLTRHVEDPEILETVESTRPGTAAHRLVGLANSRGGSDNITVFVLRVGPPTPTQEIARTAHGRRRAPPQLHARVAAPQRPSSLAIAAGLTAFALLVVTLAAAYYLGWLPPSPAAPAATLEPAAAPHVEVLGDPSATVSVTPSPTATFTPAAMATATATPPPTGNPTATPGGATTSAVRASTTAMPLTAAVLLTYGRR